jgi:hypothetical protein
MSQADAWHLADLAAQGRRFASASTAARAIVIPFAAEPASPQTYVTQVQVSDVATQCQGAWLHSGNYGAYAASGY